MDQERGAGQTETLTAGEFLAANPGFHFDLERYLLAIHHIEWLNERFSHFQALLAGEQTSRMNEDIIIRLLRDRLTHVVPAYRSLAKARTLSDIPFISKPDLRRAPEEYLNTEFERDSLWFRKTGGTTGSPVPIWWSSAFYFDHLFLTIRKFAAVTQAPYMETRPVFCLAPIERYRGLGSGPAHGQGPETSELPDAAYLMYRSDERPAIVADPTRQVGLTLAVRMDESRPTTLDRVFALMKHYNPRFIVTTVTTMELLLARTSERKLDCPKPPERVFTSGSHLSGDLRTKAQRLFGAPMYDGYGMVEFGMVGYECPDRTGFHIDETSVLVELIDPNGLPVEDGVQGEIVLSSVLNEAMPLLRYRTGDLGTVSRTPCSCGIPGPRIERLRGYDVFCLRFGDGTLVSCIQFINLLSLFPIEDFQMAQLDDNWVEFLVQPQTGLEAADSLFRDIQQFVRTLLPHEVNVTVGRAHFDKRSNFNRFRSFAR